MEPSDQRLDRRLFLGRMASLTAAAAAGPAVLSANPAAGALGGEEAVAPPGPIPLPAPATVQTTALHELTLAEAAALIRAGQLSPLELARVQLERIEAYDGTYHAFNTVLADRALETARQREAGPAEGALHGIPIALKDNYYTAGIPTTANSHFFADFVPDFDATAWRRLRAAGAILIGKTQMGPLATTRATTPEGEPTTLNAWAPFDPDVSPGGSSSGSATAVAARLASSSTGTQTGGSITGPSNAQGLTGLKPTMGRVSLYGIIPLTYTRDHPGPIARDARDAAIMLQAMAGPDPADPRSLGLPALPDLSRAVLPIERRGRPALRWPTRIGMLPGYLDDPEPLEEERLEALEPEARRRRTIAHSRGLATAAARREAVRALEGLGARIVELEPPTDWETLTSWNFNNVRLPERSEIFLEELRRDVRRFGVSLSPWINGLLLPGAEYLRGQRAKLLLLRRVLDEIFEHCDVVFQSEPFPFDMIGLPLIGFPIGRESTRGTDLPIGAILGGQPYAEDRLLSVVSAFQTVTEWHRGAPPDIAAGSTAPGKPSGSGMRRIDLGDVMEIGE